MTSILTLDHGSKRIGVARANSVAKLPEALDTIKVDGNELEVIKQYIDQHSADLIVVGWPRNLSGEETKQTDEVAEFCNQLESLKLPIIKQDETLTSVQAEKELKNARQKVSDKGMIDARAAMLILDDYLRSLS